MFVSEIRANPTANHDKRDFSDDISARRVDDHKLNARQQDVLPTVTTTMVEAKVTTITTGGCSQAGNAYAWYTTLGFPPAPPLGQLCSPPLTLLAGGKCRRTPKWSPRLLGARLSNRRLAPVQVEHHLLSRLVTVLSLQLRPPVVRSTPTLRALALAVLQLVMPDPPTTEGDPIMTLPEEVMALLQRFVLVVDPKSSRQAVQLPLQVFHPIQ